MPAPHCYGSIQARMLRYAKVTSGGAPDTGASNGYRTNALIQVGVGVELSTGADVEQLNGSGGICQAYKEADKVKRTNLDTTLCQLDSELIQLAVGGEVILDGGDAIGYELPTSDDAANIGGSLEVWTEAWNGDTAATSGGNALYWHFVFPWVEFAPGDFTLEGNTFLAFPMSGFGKTNTSLTVNGPFDDWPAAVAAHGGITSSGGWFLDTALPTTSCGYIEVTSAAS